MILDSDHQTALRILNWDSISSTSCQYVDTAPMPDLVWIFYFQANVDWYAKSLQSCPTLCDPIDGSPWGSPSLGFSRKEHWSGLPFPSPGHECEKWKWSRSVMSDSSWLHGLWPKGSSIHGIFQARVLEWGSIDWYTLSQIHFVSHGAEGKTQFSSPASLLCQLKSSDLGGLRPCSMRLINYSKMHLKILESQVSYTHRIFRSGPLCLSNSMHSLLAIKFIARIATT